MAQPTQTPCPHCGSSVYVLATTCVHCRGPLRFNPPIEKGSLEAYRLLTGWKQPALPPIEQDDTARNAKPVDSSRNHSAPVVKGISLLDAAFVLNDSDAGAAKLTKERWKKQRQKPPEPLGKAEDHSQTYLYDPNELLQNYLELVDPDVCVKFTHSAYRGFLRPVRTTGETGRKVTVAKNKKARK